MYVCVFTEIDYTNDKANKTVTKVSMGKGYMCLCTIIFRNFGYFCEFEFISKKKRFMLGCGWNPHFSWSPGKQEVPPRFQQQSLYNLDSD